MEFNDKRNEKNYLSWKNICIHTYNNLIEKLNSFQSIPMRNASHRENKHQ